MQAGRRAQFPLPEQLQFALHDESSLRAALERETGLPVRIVVTDNSSTVISMRRRPGVHVTELRLHRMFLGATPPVIEALAAWLRRPRCRKSNPILNHFIRNRRDLIRKAPKNKPELSTRGRYFDLAALYAETNVAHFGGTINAAITWGKRPPTRRRRRSIRFGSYAIEENLIRIHPYLDQEFVPEFFVRYIIFHEMLHAFLGIEEPPDARRRIHTREFRELERAYPDYERARSWESRPANVRRLLRLPPPSPAA
jgi:hypothetical protein